METARGASCKVVTNCEVVLPSTVTAQKLSGLGDTRNRSQETYAALDDNIRFTQAVSGDEACT